MIYHLIRGKASPGQTEKAKEQAVKLIARARALGRDVRVLPGVNDDARDTFVILQKHESMEHWEQMEQKVSNDPEWQKIRAENQRLHLIVDGSMQTEVFEEVG
jgi:hypothetical protein